MFHKPMRRRYVLLKLASFLTVTALLSWVLGFFWFATNLPEEVTNNSEDADVIVVLTGGSDRINTGLDLLEQGIAKKLFISGVYKGVEVQELLRLSQRSPKNLECCVKLGYQADDTRGNALESQNWIEEEGYSSLRLVTAAYHMPRSLLEFRNAMPEIQILPHPVFPQHVKQKDWWLWPGSMTLILSEYVKFLMAHIRIWFEDIQAILIG
ncbi:YdcF family protein [uncultured Kiloniella sp.]|uniref:YdcF family protein n=1 Tax=uncultured Kiloniella sp. TaxID=1133091 RepID=UPI002601C33E|nr:YdcF family protein [uncultured Kiloniella sp.]